MLPHETTAISRSRWISGAEKQGFEKPFFIIGYHLRLLF
jgi:hypothetical protein